MFYVVDQYGRRIKKCATKERAEEFCNKLNAQSEIKYHVE